MSRISPVSLLVVGFAATYWIHTRDGPLVPLMIGLESSACQTKYWSHIFFVNNIVDSTNYCMLPTWFLPVDMHMYIVVCTLTLIMWQHRRTAIKLYTALFLASSVLIGVVAYIKEYKSMIYLCTPENVRVVFRENPSFTEFYISSWGALPSCFLGLILAHVQFELDQRRIKLSEYKWFVYLHYCTSPILFVWALTGIYTRNCSSSIFFAVYAAFDRPFYCIFWGIMLLGMTHIDINMDVFVSSLILLVATSVTAREYTAEDLASFPRLFHLDDYHRCLAKKDGLYCLGTLDLTPDAQPNPTYELLKAYSDESYRHFNRTRIHRGYCVSSRCPQEAVQNASERFEQCADKWARAHTLRASINKLHYCQSHAEKHSEQPRTPAQETFLQCIYALLVINIIGTVYDLYTGNNPDKNKLIAAFSIPANWRRLTIIHEGGDPRLVALSPLNGIRVLAMISTSFAHASVIHYAFHILNPEELESQTQRIDGMFLSAGTSIIQTFVLIACFLTGYNLLMYSQKRSLNLGMLPMCILKRVIRISPVSLLVVGFAATYWIHTRDGPLVSTTIGLESSACQSKFWSHIFFVNNMVDPAGYCMLPTWFLPVDMHMYIVVCTLTLIMWRHRSTAIKLYTALFLASSVLIGVIAYIKEYKSMIYLSTPENVRVAFRVNPSITEFYMSSWGALPSCFLGLILAHVQFELDQRRIQLSEHKWFVYLHYCTFPILFVWALTGIYARNRTSSIFYAAYAAFDRPFYCIITGITLLGVTHVDSPIRRFFTWNGWITMSRVSLTAMMIHWGVNLTISTRPVAYSTSPFDVIVDWLSTIVITHIIAIPSTLLVEIPIQKFLGLLIF